MKQAIFHPEARAEIHESVEFYEARLEGLGFRFLSAVEQTTERISTHPEAGAPHGDQDVGALDLDSHQFRVGHVPPPQAGIGPHRLPGELWTLTR